MPYPIVFIGYRRADQARRVLERICDAQHTKCYIFLDGPKSEEESRECARVRQLVEEYSLRNSNTIVNISSGNMGSKLRVVSALEMVFENEDAAIILEDDCLPSASFFQFMSCMLEYYSENDAVYMVSGRNHFGESVGGSSYGFTKEQHVWGWGTWRRSWSKYKVDLNGMYNRDDKKRVMSFLEDRTYSKELFRGCDKAISGVLDAWDYQMGYVMAWHQAYCIYPKMNLVNNIGFGDMATHTKNKESWLSSVVEREIAPPYVHPEAIQADEYYYNCIEEYKKQNRKTIRQRFRSMLRKYYRRMTCGY